MKNALGEITETKNTEEAVDQALPWNLIPTTTSPFLKKFITDNEVKTVVDLGCGDFRCGPHIYNDLNVKYVGYDAYEKVVSNNKENFNPSKFQFHHLDFLNNKEKLISADMCILKDVLQHWFMEEIYSFLDYLTETKKIQIYSFV